MTSTPTPERAATRMTDETEPLLKDIERILDDESAFIARPSKAVSVRIALAAYMAAQKKITETVKCVFARIEPTICDTHKMCDDGPVSSREGRISERDFDALTAVFTEAPLRSLAAVRAPDADVAQVIDELRDLSENGLSDFPQERMVTALAVDLLISLSARLSSAERERDEARADKDGAYLERNRLVAYLASQFPSGLKPTNIEGWNPEWHGCVYIDTPAGQLSWHYHESQAHLFARLPRYQGAWDGHTTEQKYDRLTELTVSAESALAVALVERDRAREAALEEACKAVFVERQMSPGGTIINTHSLEASRWTLSRIRALKSALSPAPNATEAE